MADFSVLHPELRLRIPNKTFEMYDDALRWAANKICVKTAMWEIVTELVTVADKDIYDIDLPSYTVIHSNLYIIQKGAVNPTSGAKAQDRIIERPVNGIYNGSIFGAPSNYPQSFQTVGETQIQILPMPKDGGITLQIYTAIKPSSSASRAANDKFFNEYKDALVEGAMFRLFDINGDIERADREGLKFKNSITAIHMDVIKQNANTPLKLSAGW